LLVSIHGSQRMRGDEHLSTCKPASRVGDQISNRPKMVIEIELFDPAYFPIEAV
jgi:hypothetical protein